MDRNCLDLLGCRTAGRGYGYTVCIVKGSGRFYLGRPILGGKELDRNVSTIDTYFIDTLVCGDLRSDSGLGLASSKESRERHCDSEV